MKPSIYAIVPARSGSKGLPNKNIKVMHGYPLIKYSIDFAKSLDCIDRVFCSTDSEEYKEIAVRCGAEVPFLRSPSAAIDTAMEPEILIDLRQKFIEWGIDEPDLLVWLRPTFVFRSKSDVLKCINMLKERPEITSARTVCETESRIYEIKNQRVIPKFEDNGASMIRRQDVGIGYKVFSTDVIRFKGNDFNDDFLGRNVGAVVTNKLCGLDIDDEFDFQLVKSILVSGEIDVQKYCE